MEILPANGGPTCYVCMAYAMYFNMYLIHQEQGWGAERSYTLESKSITKRLKKFFLRQEEDQKEKHLI